MTISIGKDGVKEGASASPPPEEAERAPEAWDSWFPKRFKALQDWLKERDRKKISNLLLTQQRLTEAHRAVHRATLTRRFLESEFWLEFLKPALGDEQDIKPWVPGDARSLEQVAVDHLFASGKAAFAKVVLKKFEEWIRVGEEAKKIIALDSERRGQMREITRA